MYKRISFSAGALVLASLVTACSGYPMPSFPLPEEPGLYAITPEEELRRLDGDREWEVKSWPSRAALSPYTEFVVYDPALARDPRPDSEMIDFWRVAWVRSEIDAQGAAGPVRGSEWAVAPIESFKVPATVKTVDGWPEHAHVVPQRPLEPGLYSLRLERVGSSRVGRIGVEWDSLDKRQYAAANCVDRYPASEPRYRTCTGGGDLLQSTGAQGLEITLVDPLRQGNDLIVQGIVENTADTRRSIPGMQAILLDEQGRRLMHSLIEPRRTELSAGERMKFRTEIRNPPAKAARIDVIFVPMTNAGM